MNNEGPLYRDSLRFRATHERWSDRRNRSVESDGYQEEWYQEQCGSCRYWIPPTGEFAFDDGGCSNPASMFDKQVIFEHDRCPAHKSAGERIVSGNDEP